MAAALIAKGNPVVLAEFSKEWAEGYAEGLAEARAEVRALGRAEGLAEALGDIADAIVRVLARRNLTPTPAELERFRAERDPAILDRWVDRAMTCNSVMELIASDDRGALRPVSVRHADV